jgi:hypothetical protein
MPTNVAVDELPDEWNRLFEAWSRDALDEAGSEQLGQLLNEDTEAQSAFRAYASSVSHPGTDRIARVAALAEAASGDNSGSRRLATRPLADLKRINPWIPAAVAAALAVAIWWLLGAPSPI